MVHVQHALPAFGTMVASFWFEVVTDQAKLPLLGILVVKRPQDRHSPGISGNHGHIGTHTHDVEEGCAYHPPSRQVDVFVQIELHDV